MTRNAALVFRLVLIFIMGMTASLRAESANGAAELETAQAPETCAVKLDAVPYAANAICFDQNLMALEENRGLLFPSPPFHLMLVGGGTRAQHDAFICFKHSFGLAEFDKAKDIERSGALPFLNRLTLHFTVGDYRPAEKYAFKAKGITDQIEQKGGRGGGERHRIFKGEPYERAMLDIYLGILLLQREDYDNARAMFLHALENDRESVREKDVKKKRDDALVYGEDNRLAHYLFACANFQLGDANTAEIALRKAALNYAPISKKRLGSNLAIPKKYFNETPPPTSSPYLSLEALENHNLRLLIETGRAPIKIAVGEEGQRDKLRPRFHREHTASVFIDGEYAGVGHPVLSLTHQALSMPRTAKDAAQTGKMFLKKMVESIAPVRDVWSIAADTRIWGSLPDETHLFSARVAPGLHTITVLFHDENGAPVPRSELTYYFIPAPEEGSRLIVLRAVNNRCNAATPIRAGAVISYQKKKRTIQFRPRDLSPAPVVVGETLTVFSLVGPPPKPQTNVRLNRKQGAAADCAAEIGARIKMLGAAVVTEVKGKVAYAEYLGEEQVKKYDYVTRDSLDPDRALGYSNHFALDAKINEGK